MGLTTFHVNNAPVIGLALDASTGILYETDGGNDITAFNAATGALVNFFGTTASAIASGSGTVFFTAGNAINDTSSNLVGLNTFHVNNAPPTGLALDVVPVAAVPEPSSVGLMLAGLAVWASRRLRSPGRRRA